MKYKTACAIIVNNKDQLLLVKRGRDPFKDCWALVSGIGESKKGIPPEVGIKEEVRWDLGTESFEGSLLFRTPIENDPFTDEVYVFLGRVDETNITMRPGFSIAYRWVDITDTAAFEDLAFEHSAIVKQYILEQS